MASVLSLTEEPVCTPQLPKTAPEAVPTPAAKADRPVTLRSDRFAFAFWLVCAVLMAGMMVKEMVMPIFTR
jgi:hypothetical protein